MHLSTGKAYHDVQSYNYSLMVKGIAIILRNNCSSKEYAIFDHFIPLVTWLTNYNKSAANREHAK